MSTSRSNLTSCDRLPQVLVTSKAQASLSVAVRVRPILKAELAKNSNKKDIIRVIDGKVVVVLDPDDTKVGAVEYVHSVLNGVSLGSICVTAAQPGQRKPQRVHYSSRSRASRPSVASGTVISD